MEYKNNFHVMQQSFASNLVEARTKAAISQQNLALLADIDQTSIARFEKGTGNPSLYMMYKLAKALNTSVYNLTMTK